MEKQRLLLADRNVFTLGHTNCMGNVTHYQFDVLFEHIKWKWALESKEELAEILRRPTGKIFETHKKLGKSFFPGDPYTINFYLESEDENSVILAGDFVSEKTTLVHTSVKQRILKSEAAVNNYRVSETLKRAFLFELSDLVTLGETSYLKCVPTHQYDILFGRTREMWALKVVSGLLQGLGEKINLETVQTHKYQLFDFFVGHPYVIKLYAEDLKKYSFILSADFIHGTTGKVHAVMQQKIAATEVPAGKICEVPPDLRRALETKSV
jgi:acyl-CoA thioesterase FadM